jgi:hypothetical protein
MIEFESSHWGAFIALAIGLTFAGFGVQSLRTGIARIPIQLFVDDEFERGDTMFGLIVALDFIGALGGLALAYAIESGSL